MEEATSRVSNIIDGIIVGIIVQLAMGLFCGGLTSSGRESESRHRGYCAVCLMEVACR